MMPEWQETRNSTIDPPAVNSNDHQNNNRANVLPLRRSGSTAMSRPSPPPPPLPLPLHSPYAAAAARYSRNNSDGSAAGAGHEQENSSYVRQNSNAVLIEPDTEHSNNDNDNQRRGQRQSTKNGNSIGRLSLPHNLFSSFTKRGQLVERSERRKTPPTIISNGHFSQQGEVNRSFIADQQQQQHAAAAASSSPSASLSFETRQQRRATTTHHHLAESYREANLLDNSDAYNNSGECSKQPKQPPRPSAAALAGIGIAGASTNSEFLSPQIPRAQTLSQQQQFSNNSSSNIRKLTNVSFEDDYAVHDEEADGTRMAGAALQPRQQQQQQNAFHRQPVGLFSNNINYNVDDDDDDEDDDDDDDDEDNFDDHIYGILPASLNHQHEAVDRIDHPSTNQYVVDDEAIDAAYPGAVQRAARVAAAAAAMHHRQNELDVVDENDEQQQQLNNNNNNDAIDGNEKIGLLNDDRMMGTLKSSASSSDDRWDVFRLQERDDGTRWDKMWVTRSTQILKLVAYLVTFLFVLLGAVISKGTLLLMVSQLSKNRIIRVCSASVNPNAANNNIRSSTSGLRSTTEIDMPTTVIASWVWAVNGAFCVVEMFKFFHCWRKCHFRRVKRPELFATVFVVATEMAHCAGIAIFLFRILPTLDVVRGAMAMSCVSIVPAILKMCSRQRGEKKLLWKLLLDTGAIVAQATGILIWPLLDSKNSATTAGGSDFMWLPFASLLVSFVWWENFVSAESSFTFIVRLATFAERLHKSKWRIYKYLAPIKCACMVGLSLLLSDVPVEHMFQPKLWFANLHVLATTRTTSASSAAAAVLNGLSSSSAVDPVLFSPNLPGGATMMNGTQAAETSVLQVIGWLPLLLLVIHVVTAMICYQAGKFACRVCIQSFSFAFPLNLATPVLVSVLIAICGFRSRDSCSLPAWWPPYLFWHCIDNDDGEDLGRSVEVGGVGAVMLNSYVLLWFLWIFSHTWITIHIWSPRCERLAKADKLFVLPLFNNILLDQDMALNRRRDDGVSIRSNDIRENLDKTGINLEDSSPHYEEIEIGGGGGGGGEDRSDVNAQYARSSRKRRTAEHPDTLTKIFVCATMWHETAPEMRQMLKSIVRLDEDQAARRMAQQFLQVVDPDYYEFETHIFFDDAFELNDIDIDDGGEEENVANRFVRLLVEVIDDAASAVHETSVKLKPPVKIPTPYGGRLVWTLPGKNTMTVHMKDKSKIRHRKRWSQVMYMYYLLGHRLMELPLSVERKEIIAENTYILTLDGDIDFQPTSVQLLIDLMKKNRNLGAACGRIHPTGSGPMVWYQQFEYAIGHWLQKATEHVLGCVLCSPGCFSVFRAKGLMDDNVMRRYAMKSEEALHYVQFDQGEDRWLCTLLLQRGYRVEYSAASDSYTHAPEGFDEFFNQRRRWAPSTLANIFDLLLDARRVIKANDSFSIGYIIYQVALMIGTILGPGTIFLMIVGACNVAFRLDNVISLQYNLYPVLGFIIICFTMNGKIQLLVAFILSTLYAMLMMAVIVGMSLQIHEDGVSSPSAVFFFSLFGSYLVAAVLHPQEFGNLFFVGLYFLSIPSMYMLLMIYSLINMNVVTWGTRETMTRKTKAEVEKEKHEAARAQKQKLLLGGLLKLNSGDGADDTGHLQFSCGNLCKVLLCVEQSSSVAAQQQQAAATVAVEATAKAMEQAFTTTNQHFAKVSRQLNQIGSRINNFERHLGMDGVGSRTTSAIPLVMQQQQTSHATADGRHRELLISGDEQESENDDEGSQLLLENQQQQQQQQQQAETNPAGAARRATDFVAANDEDDWISLGGGALTVDNNLRGQTPPPARDDMVNPFWIEDEKLGGGAVGALAHHEIAFWHQLIAKYLHPIDEDKTEQARIATDLQALRNKCAFAFFMFNALFVLIVFLLQLNKEVLHIQWPMGVKENVTLVKETGEVKIEKVYLQLEPIGIMFVMFFFAILLIQFTCMLFHRYTTLEHILAATELPWLRRHISALSAQVMQTTAASAAGAAGNNASSDGGGGNAKHADGGVEAGEVAAKPIVGLKFRMNDALKRHAVSVARQMQQLRGFEDDSMQYGEVSAGAGDGGGEGPTIANSREGSLTYMRGVGNRRIVANLDKRLKNRRKRVRTLDAAFKRRFLQFAEQGSRQPIRADCLKDPVKFEQVRQSALCAMGESISRGHHGHHLLSHDGAIGSLRRRFQSWKTGSHSHNHVEEDQDKYGTRKNVYDIFPNAAAAQAAALEAETDLRPEVTTMNETGSTNLRSHAAFSRAQLSPNVLISLGAPSSTGSGSPYMASRSSSKSSSSIEANGLQMKNLATHTGKDSNA